MEKIIHTYKLYTEVYLDRDLPSSNLKKGDVGTLIDFVSHPEKEEGAILEFFTAMGEHFQLATVPLSWIRPLASNQIRCVRNLNESM